METLSQAEFDERWRSAEAEAETVEVKAKRVQLDLSLNTVLNNYQAQLEKALRAHALEREEFESIRGKIQELQTEVKKVEAKTLDFLRIG